MALDVLALGDRDLEVAQGWFSAFEGAGLDGIVAKPLEGTYQPDKRAMLKIKHVRTGVESIRTKRARPIRRLCGCTPP